MNDSTTPSSSTSRRDFLTNSAAAVVGGSLIANATRAADPEPAPTGEPAAARPKRNWKKGFYGNYGAKDATIIEKFKLLKEAGFDGLEINCPSGKQDEYLSAFKETGLQCEGVVDAVHWNTTLSDADPKRRAVA